MSRSRYFIIIAGLLLSVSFLLLAQGEPVFADELDYSEWNYFDNADYYTPPPETYPNLGNETYYAPEVIQDPFNVFQTQYSQPIDNYGLLDDGTTYAPAWNAGNGSDAWGFNPWLYLTVADEGNALNQNTQNQYSSAETDSVAQTIVPPENPLFTRIFGNWNLTDQPPAPAEVPIVLANNEYTDLQLPPNWGVSETRTDAYPRTLLVGGSGSDTKSQDSSDTVAGGYLNTSAYRSPGPQPHMAETGFSPKGIVLNAINYVKDFVTAGSATNVNVTGVGPKRVEVDSGGVSYTARAIPGGAYVQAEWNIDSFFRLVKPK